MSNTGQVICYIMPLNFHKTWRKPFYFQFKYKKTKNRRTLELKSKVIQLKESGSKTERQAHQPRRLWHLHSTTAVSDRGQPLLSVTIHSPTALLRWLLRASLANREVEREMLRSLHSPPTWTPQHHAAVTWAEQLPQSTITQRKRPGGLGFSNLPVLFVKS